MLSTGLVIECIINPEVELEQTNLLGLVQYVGLKKSRKLSSYLTLTAITDTTSTKVR